MKWIRLCTAVVAMMGLCATSNVADAGLLDDLVNWGSAKDCGCAPTYEPECCKPTITKPCEPKVHSYQRGKPACKPPECGKCAAPKHACAPKCKKPAKPKCKMPAAPKCKRPAAPKCHKPAKKCAPSKCCDRGCDTGCDKGGCDMGCCGDQMCCDADPCKIAELIYQSQTACYADDREDAIHELGDNYNCVCNPEIMSAFIYALNDADEDVRAKAADEIGDQLREWPCCCSKEVVSALTCALSDCDDDVVRQAEEGLEACGYEVVEGYCDVCDTSCDPCGPCGGCGSMPKQKNGGDNGEAAPAPAPPEDPKAYFPSRLLKKNASRTPARHKRLGNLFGLLD